MKKKKETKAQRLRRMRSQGRYIGLVCHLSAAKRKQVAQHRTAHGIRAAMQLARSLLSSAA